MLLLIDVGPL